MNEKYYKKVKRAGGFSIALGIVSLITGVSCGILMIITGAKLLAAKSDRLF